MAQATARKRAAPRNAGAAAGTAEAVRVPVSTRTDILVKATRLGYYNLTRDREGDTFYLNAEEDFSNRWMVAVDDNREEIPGESARLQKIADLARRKHIAEVAQERAAAAPENVEPVSVEKLDKELEAARAAAPKRAAPKRGKADATVGLGENDDPKRKIAGTDYERHEDAKPTDNQGPEPRGGRASDKNVA